MKYLIECPSCYFRFNSQVIVDEVVRCPDCSADLLVDYVFNNLMEFDSLREELNYEFRPSYLDVLREELNNDGLSLVEVLRVDDDWGE